MLRRIIALCVIFSLIGCTSLQKIEPISYGSISDEVTTGDEIIITFFDGSRVSKTVVTVTQEGIFVKSPNGSILISYSEVRKIEKRSVSSGKTAGSLLLGTLLVLLVIGLAGAELMDELGSD